VQAPQDIPGGAGVVVLDKAAVKAGQLLPDPLVEAFEEKTAFVPEHLGFEH